VFRISYVQGSQMDCRVVGIGRPQLLEHANCHCEWANQARALAWRSRAASLTRFSNLSLREDEPSPSACMEEAINSPKDCHQQERSDVAIEVERSVRSFVIASPVWRGDGNPLKF
jgi:hypothetical protein